MHKEFLHTQPFTLESGHSLDGLTLLYTTRGHLNERKDNVVWIFHALTANADPFEWWPGLVGTGAFFDPTHYFIVCVNMPGSCYGSTGPLSKNPINRKGYYHEFPFFTPRDMVRAYTPLKEHLGIEKIWLGIGGSMGGQQLLEWAIEEPHLFEHIVPIATNANHSPWGIAFNESQRMAIAADATWKKKNATAGLLGMKAARSIALLSYRHYDTYGISQKEKDENKVDHFKSTTYQQYQGEKLAKRFNAFSYWTLSKSMDSHNIGRHRGGIKNALKKIKAHTLVIGISSDLLFPPGEQKAIANGIKNSKLEIIDSHYGHDGFLLEYEALTKLLKKFLRTTKK